MCEFVSWCEIGFEAQAAWTQAILSVLAIIAAAWFPHWTARRDRARRVTALMELIGSLSDRVDDACNKISRSEYGQSYIHDHAGTEMREYVAALDSIPLDNLPGPSLLLIVVGLREELRELQDLRKESFGRVQAGQGVPSANAEKAREIAKIVEGYYGETVEIDRKHTPLTFRQRRAMRAAGIRPGARLPTNPA